MKEIRIEFVDFWPDLIKTNNYFYNILSEYYTVIIDKNNPEILFFSLFGSQHLKYTCKKVFFTGENRRPNFSSCDFAFTFDYIDKKNHFRLPLYSFYIDDYNLKNSIEDVKSKEELREIWKEKEKFCSMVVSNPRATERIEFFKRLSKIKKVDSGGGVLNNIGGRVENKLEFINKYKFVISFENEIYDGYTTEKIIEPIFKHCIPIYWGNRLVNRDFNPKRFINYHDFNTEDDLFNRLLEIEENPELALEIISQPIFSKERQSYLEERKTVYNYIKVLLESTEKPVSKKNKGKFYYFKIKLNSQIRKLKKKLKGRHQ
jgi:hypothetical protein